MTESLIRVMVRVLWTRVQLAAGFALLFDRVDFSDVGPQQVGVRGQMRSELRVETLCVRKVDWRLVQVVRSVGSRGVGVGAFCLYP